MAITINVNGSLVLDETSGLQIGPDLSIPLADNDAGLSYDSSTNQLTSAVLDAEFLDYLEGLFALDAAEDAALGHAATVGGASSSDSFITVTAGAGETIDNLFFKVSGNGLITTATTLANEALYFHVDPLNSDRAVLTTSETAGAGRIVAAFHLDEADNHLSAQVQMVTFEALRHTNPNNPDEPINFSDVLQVGATGSLSFDFDNLDSGNFLWVAIGTESAGLLVTGRDLNVQDSGGKLGQYIPGGNDDPSDSMNTSQGGEGATIGVNAQHFVAGGNNQNPADGSTAVFTLVRGFVPLPTDAQATSTNQQATGTNVLDIDYGVAGPDPDYINTTGAGLFVSQLTGANADMRISLWSAGGGTTAEEGFAYIGNQATDSAFFDDTAITVGTVTVTRGGTTFVFTLANQANLQGGIKVTFGAGADDNSFTITGLQELDSVKWTTTGGETFNRFQVTALATTGAFDLGRVDILQGFDSSQGLGSHLYVDDDGPTITGPGTQPSLTVDESNFALNDTQDFSGAFTRNFGTDGQALSTPISYALGIGAGASGLIDSLSGEAVVLSLVGGIVFGRTETGGDEVFRVTVDGSGNVTLNQSRAVMHLPENGPDQSTTLASDGLVTLSSTITDRDGDQATASINIGQNLNFEDDFPTASLDRIEGVFATVDESNLGADALVLGSSLLSPSIDYRADGAGSAVYSLDVVSLNGETNLTTTDGQAITLVENGPTEVRGIYGSNQIAFIIVINPDNGSVLLDQIVALYHPDASDPDDSVFLDSGILNMVLTVTDADGDSASDPADIGPALQFRDDGPDVSPGEDPPALTVDETDFDDNASASFADAFNRDFGNDGEAATDPVTYVLGINAGITGLVDTLSGLAVVLDTDGNDVVGLAGPGGAEVFRVSVNSATGEVTLDQSRAVEHANPADPDDSTALLTNNLITLTATITDGDGDQDSHTIGIARSLNFEDDGPDIARNDQVRPYLFTDDSLTPGDSDGPVGFASLFDTAFGNDGFKDSDDNDVADDDAVTYALSVNGGNGTNSGLSDSLSGDPILLRINGDGDVEGYVADGDLLVFKIALDELTGEITQTQYRAIIHDDPNDPEETGDGTEAMAANLIVLTATATDGDGDTDSAATDIGDAFRFADDGPTVEAPSVQVIVDDDGGAGGNSGGSGDVNAPREETGSVVPIFDFGADGQQSYTISLANLINPPALTSQGGTVRYHQNGNFLTGYVDIGTQGDGYQASDREVFTFDLNGTSGDFTFSLIDQIDHPTAGTEDNLLINLGVLLQAVDGDGDKSSAAAPIQLNIDFDDDSPEITAQISDGLVDGNVVPSSVTNSLNGAVGFDDNGSGNTTGAGVKTYTFSSFVSPTNAWPNLVGVMSADKTTINFYESGAANADLVYSITLDQANAGAYTFTVHKQTTSQRLEFDFADLPSGQNLFGVLVDRSDAGVLQVDGKGLLVVGRDAVLDNVTGAFTNASDTINTSKGGGGVTIGVDNQMFDPGDGAIFVFLNNPDDKCIGGGLLTQNTADDADTLGFAATYSTRSAELEVVQKQGSAICGMRITAYNVDVPGVDDTIVSAANPLGADVNAEGRAFMDDPRLNGTIVSIDTVKVFDRANPNVLLLDATVNQSTGAITYGTQASGYSLTATQTAPGSGVWTVTVTGFNANDSIVYTTVGDHDAVLTEGTSGKWDLGGINLTESIDLPDQLFDFTVAINDYDGDSGGGAGVAFANFQVGVDGTGAADDGIVAGVNPAPVPIAPLVEENVSFEVAVYESGREAADFDFAQIYTLGQQHV